jgi:hypothetical protein
VNRFPRQKDSAAGRMLPWARPRSEGLLLVLVALAALSPVNIATPQDQSRLCLSEAVVHGRLYNDTCLSSSFDRARYAGHLYSDKAPGLSFLALAPVELVRLGPPQRWASADVRLWAVRVLTVGIAFLLVAFMVGRVSEGLRQGYGPIALVTFALGTLVAPFAAVGYEHVVAAALAFGGFLLAWNRRPALAGLVGGAAVLVEYECGLVLVVVGVYLARLGWRPLAPYLAGVAPAAALLGAYDWIAFGAPWHLSYRYVENGFSGEQATGLFGLGWPRAFGVTEVLAGSRGLLVVSPVLVLAVLGLVRLGRSYRAEALAAGAVAAIFILSNFGYFDPYGGSPGPRFLIAALPFLALGLAPAFAWLPGITTIAAALSVVPVTVLTLTWSKVYYPGAVSGPSGGVWGDLAGLIRDVGTGRLAGDLAPNVTSRLGAAPVWGALLVVVSAAAAFAVAAARMPWAEIRARARQRPRATRSWKAVLAGAGLCYLIVAADVLAVTDYPYGPNPQVQLVLLRTSITAPAGGSYLGGDVNFTVSVTNAGTVGAGHLRLELVLSPGLRLVGPPALTRGTGCRGRSTLRCDLGFLQPQNGQHATVLLGAQVTQPRDQELRAWASAQGDPRSNVASVVVSIGR